MTVAIMQPYFFPYIGYFQLINAVDKFVIYDDVNYIKQGWINRNRILLNGTEFLLTLKVEGASSFKKINEISVGKGNDKLTKTLMQGYRQSPYFLSVFPVIESIILQKESNLAKYISQSVKDITDYLSIKTTLVDSSEINKNNDLKSQAKVIDICKNLEADTYINAIGGRVLYNKEDFKKENIELKFLKSKTISYKQFGADFIPWLSIIDILMFNSLEETCKLLNQYELV